MCSFIRPSDMIPVSEVQIPSNLSVAPIFLKSRIPKQKVAVFGGKHVMLRIQLVTLLHDSSIRKNVAIV